eukprot:GHVQ01012648.1.p1 GENE.GHVQ01012648.1~~GHVQ01012648.1.p1  ORF type:complete len:233 (+),score=18.54 GHVQ01012648.1:216-914(+)
MRAYERQWLSMRSCILSRRLPVPWRVILAQLVSIAAVAMICAEAEGCCKSMMSAGNNNNAKVVENSVTSAEEHMKPGDTNCCGMMPMYFTNTIHTIILFSGWETVESWQYGLSCFACILFGIISVMFKVIRLRSEQEMKLRERNARRVLSIPVLHNTYRMAEAFIIYVWDYLLMLVVMTFNVGLVLSVCSGLALGFLFFGHKLRVKNKARRSSSKSEDIIETFKADPACCGA